MKNTLLIISCLLLVFIAPASLMAQSPTVKNSIRIQNNKIPSKEEYYKAAIYRANMENYRLKDKDVILSFKEGFECVMLSAKSLAARGITIDVDSYQNDFTNNFIIPTFSITDDGHLIATYQKVGKQK